MIGFPTVREVGGSDSPLISDARILFEEYQGELGIDLCFQGFAEELENLPGAYAPPSGALLLFERDGEFVACGALRFLETGVCELKRIYVRPAARGNGLGRLMTDLLLERALELGYERVRLDTLARLEPALAMYEAMGFQRIEPYNFNPEPDIVYLERPLA